MKTGASEIELIQPLKGRPPYTEFLDLHGEGVHHLAYVVKSIDQYLEPPGRRAPPNRHAGVHGGLCP
ncbi:VOC family protein [Streptomyces sp. DSM 41534]